MRILILLTLLLSSVAQADYKLIVGGFSKHPYPMEAEKNYFFSGVVRDGQVLMRSKYAHRPAVSYNETHPAIGVERNGKQAALYLNSYNQWSFALTDIKPLFKGAGFRYGVASGYELDAANIRGILPIAQFVISKEYEHITVDLGLSTVSTVIFKVNL